MAIGKANSGYHIWSQNKGMRVEKEHFSFNLSLHCSTMNICYFHNIVFNTLKSNPN